MADIRDIAFEQINADFSRGSYLGINMLIHMKSGYVNGTQLVAQSLNGNGNPKRITNWQDTKQCKELAIDNRAILSNATLSSGKQEDIQLANELDAKMDNLFELVDYIARDVAKMRSEVLEIRSEISKTNNKLNTLIDDNSLLRRNVAAIAEKLNIVVPHKSPVEHPPCCDKIERK